MSLVFKSLMLIIALQDVTTVLAKPTKAPVIMEKTQPLYELQLAVWPTEVDDIIEAVVAPVEQVTLHPLIDQPIAVMPDMDYSQDDEILNDDAAALDDDDNEVVYDPSLDLWPTIIADDQKPVKPDPVVVLENYHKKFANGSEEYKLLLSNGMANFQHIDHVPVKGVLKPVQEGYYTVPIEGVRDSYQTVYYRADKNGYNVYKTEQSPRNPAYDFYLQYAKDEDAKIQ